MPHSQTLVSDTLKVKCYEDADAAIDANRYALSATRQMQFIRQIRLDSSETKGYCWLLFSSLISSCARDKLLSTSGAFTVYSSDRSLAAASIGPRASGLYGHSDLILMNCLVEPEQ